MDVLRSRGMLACPLRSVKYILNGDSNEQWKFEENRSNGENSIRKNQKIKTPAMSCRIVSGKGSPQDFTGALPVKITGMQTAHKMRTWTPR